MNLLFLLLGVALISLYTLLYVLARLTHLKDLRLHRDEKGALLVTHKSQLNELEKK